MVVSDTSGTNDGNNTTSGSDDPTVSDSVPSAADDTTEIDLGGNGNRDESQQSELEALRAERDALQEQLDAEGSRHRFVHGLRGVTAVVGVVLSCLLVAGAVLGIWASRSFLEADGFNERADSLIEDPEVRGAISGWLSTEVNKLIDAESVIEDALPPEASLLAAPLSGAVNSFVDDQVTAFVNSDLFAELWVDAVALAYSTASDVLSEDGDVVEATQDGVVINFLPIVNEVLADITSASPEIFGQTVNLPDITVEDIPEDARDAIGDALGVTIDDSFGTFTIYDEGALSAAQRAVKLVNQLVWLFVILTPLVIAGTLWVSTRRRRTLLQLTAGVVITMVLLRRLVMLFQDDLLELVKKPENLGAVDSIASTFLDPLLDGALWVGVIALLVAVIAMVSGPYGWAVSLRKGVAGTARTVATDVSERSQDEGTLVWVAAQRTALQIGGVVFGVLVLWLFDLSWFWFFVLVAVIGAYEFGVQQLADRGEALDGDRDSDGGAETPDDGDAPGESEPASATTG